MSMVARAELADVVGVRYRGATRAERARILDKFAAVTGYHRKHAIWLLANGGNREEEVVASDCSLATPSRQRAYGVEVRDALIQLWNVADRVCSKWLRPMVPVLLPALEQLVLKGGTGSDVDLNTRIRIYVNVEDVNKCRIGTRPENGCNTLTP